MIIRDQFILFNANDNYNRYLSFHTYISYPTVAGTFFLYFDFFDYSTHAKVLELSNLAYKL